MWQQYGLFSTCLLAVLNYPLATQPPRRPCCVLPPQMYGLAHEEGSVSVLNEKSPKPRRQTGRWMPEEVEALIEGESGLG